MNVNVGALNDSLKPPRPLRFTFVAAGESPTHTVPSVSATPPLKVSLTVAQLSMLVAAKETPLKVKSAVPANKVSPLTNVCCDQATVAVLSRVP